MVKVGEEAFQELSDLHREEIVEGKVIPPLPRKERSDKFETRGCNPNPATRPKTRRRGKMPNSPTIVEDSDGECVPEIEVFESEGSVQAEVMVMSEIEDLEESEG